MAVFFVLKRSGWGYADLYEAIKTGEKTSEWRDASDHWRRRLLTKDGIKNLKQAEKINPETIFMRRWGKPFFLINFPKEQWKHNKARFRVGYTLSPTLEADIKNILYHSETNQFEVRLENVTEIR